jgi:hypothetical protein
VDQLTDPVTEILRELSAGAPVLTKEQIFQAERDINEKMERFSIEHRHYIGQSIESARHAYITF